MSTIIRRRMYILVLLIPLMLLAVSCALANDEELPGLLPGIWTCSGADEDEAVPGVTLTLGTDGQLTLCGGEDGSVRYGGTWALELTTEYSSEYGLRDKLTLNFSDTGSGMVTCLYYVHAEAWVADDTAYTYLLLEEAESSGLSPLEELTGEEGSAALYRVQGPNMRVVNCKNYVSLRSKPSKNASRLAKVPPGALVLAFPEEQAGNGFVYCVYHDEYGYILTEYLQPVD